MWKGWTLVCVLALLTVGGADLVAQDNKPEKDARVEQALNEAKIAYNVDKDNDFKIEFPVGDGRTQIVFVNSAVETMGAGMQIREVWAPVMKVEGSAGIDAKVANQLLSSNRRYKVGAWEIRPMGENQLVTFTARVPADLGSEDLAAVVRVVAKIADDMEKELTGKDDL
jgi:hypothetical protein